MPWHLVDATDEDSPEAEAERLAEDELNRPFSLAHPPLVRLLLIKLAPQRHGCFGPGG
jgi:hypothetical protein